MDPLGIFHLQRGDVFEHRVRHAAAVFRIDRSAVADFLEEEVAAGMGVQGGQAANQVEVPPMPVQVAGDHHLVGQFGREDDDVPFPAGRIAVGFRRLAENGDRSFNVVD